MAADMVPYRIWHNAGRGRWLGMVSVPARARLGGDRHAQYAQGQGDPAGPTETLGHDATQTHLTASCIECQCSFLPRTRRCRMITGPKGKRSRLPSG